MADVVWCNKSYWYCLSFLSQARLELRLQLFHISLYSHPKKCKPLLTTLFQSSCLQQYKHCIRTCWHVTNIGQLKWTNGQNRRELIMCVCVRVCVRMCGGMRVCVILSFTRILKLNCWLSECTLFCKCQNILFFFFYFLSALNCFPSQSKPPFFWHPGLIHQEQSTVFKLRNLRLATSRPQERQ